jgi:hypothetical protein
MRHPAVASQRLHLSAKEGEQRSEGEIDHAPTSAVAPARRPSSQSSFRVRQALSAITPPARAGLKRRSSAFWTNQRHCSSRRHERLQLQ